MGLRLKLLLKKGKKSLVNLLLLQKMENSESEDLFQEKSIQ